MDLDTLDQPSGANRGITLLQGRANFKQYGAYEEAMVKNVVPVAKRGRLEYSRGTSPKPGNAAGEARRAGQTLWRRAASGHRRRTIAYYFLGFAADCHDVRLT